MDWQQRAYTVGACGVALVLAPQALLLLVAMSERVLVGGLLALEAAIELLILQTARLVRGGSWCLQCAGIGKVLAR